MAENNKKNNLLYSLLVLAGLLLLLIPFFIFDVGSSVNGTGHLTRFGLHILAFAGALLAGSMFSTGITSASGSAAAIKVVAFTSAAVIGTAVTMNTAQYIHSDVKMANLATLADSISLDTTSSLRIDTLSANNNASISDTSIESNTNNEELAIKKDNTESSKINDNSSSENNINENVKTSEQNSNTKNTTTNTEKITSKETTNTSNQPKNNNTLAEICNSFQVLHGTKQLDRKLGLSIFDPNKNIRFNNDCGCILKDAAMSISRGNKIVEQKTQNGNFINLHSFKDVQVDDRLTVEIKQANCKDTKGLSFLYTFPKSILTVILISDHKEFETSADVKNNKKNPKETIDNSTVKPIKKDIIEEESNKFGN